MMEFDSWDDDIPNMMGKIKFMFQTTNQINSESKNQSRIRFYLQAFWGFCKNYLPKW